MPIEAALFGLSLTINFGTARFVMPVALLLDPARTD
jgi:hypothetical protein